MEIDVDIMKPEYTWNISIDHHKIEYDPTGLNNSLAFDFRLAFERSLEGLEAGRSDPLPASSGAIATS
ncbi:hypothetical protein NQ317_014770 [Molorchus minor]|uniref:Uncharacterized protein n=1 Tax=Molorchus minor TaxID=1323400 RepID=A0ABQ9J9X3_9CUCU|nr:hypothetical protein NQ317_014770 [Molorchus minor]